MIIGLCGLIGSGKNTAAEYLMKEYGFISVSFAETLKDAAACIFGWDRDMLEGSTKEAREAREVKDEWWSERLGFDVSPRYMLQFMGTEVMRDNLHPEIWALATEKRKNPEHIHPSETAWNNEFFDATIYNDGRIDQLYGTVDVLLDNLPKA